MKRIRWLVVLAMATLLHTQQANAQSKIKQFFQKQTEGGNFSLGVRNTISTFSHGDPKSFGIGAGGQFRMQLTDRINTEWFADVFSNNVKNKAHRTDCHIGWSVMYYLIEPRSFKRKFTPYIVAGHCFDYTRIKINGENGELAKRWSSAVQAGIGCHYNVTPKFDISLAAQYMLHLGKELHTHEEENGRMEIEEHKNAGWEGHLLISLSVNYKFLKLWKPKA